MEFIETLEFESIYKDMQTQFPKAELKTYEHLKEIAGDNYRIYQVVENEPVGYVILFETEDFFYLYITKEHAALVNKKGFKIGDSDSFSEFIKNKCKFKYKEDAVQAN